MSTIDVEKLKALEWRQLGPFRGGRSVAVAGDPSNPATFYFGSTGGGVWKTTDGGVIWENVSDGFFQRASVGALAVSTADPNVVYAGMGEAHIRGNVSHGDGVYRSTDGGRSWTHCGLAETRNISRVRVDPHDANRVYMAALGHAHGPNPERGIFRSTDGGASWEQVLHVSDQAGAIDLTLDANPRMLYAAFWEAQRYPHHLNSGGPGSGIWRSTDGGETWEALSHKAGLPEGTLGKIGIAASPAQSGRVYAIVEAKDGAVFRSDDYGETWQRCSEDGNLRQRAWYYHHIYADPQDPDTCWVLNFAVWKSTNGGQSFSAVPTRHGDNHDLWINPHNSDWMIEANDGGAHISFNGGHTWSSIFNQPTVEFYHVTTDNQVPYRIYGAQQDNTTISLPSRSDTGTITRADWHDIGGGESGYIAVLPEDHNIVFAGSYGGLLTRYDHRTGQRQNINVRPETSLGTPASDLKYRFQWTFPTHLSPHDSSVLYVTSQHVHRSTDQGMSWEDISPDLTRNDKSKQGPSGGELTGDNVGTEYYDTIFAFAESPVTKGILWTGSDDGLIHVSRDNGQSWTNVTPPASQLPEWALISIIEASPHDAGTGYVAATRYKLDDFKPYLFKTNDYGAHWTAIVNGIPEDTFTRAVREDPNRKGLLYAGTETGLYISFDDGENWQRFHTGPSVRNSTKLPVVPIHDLVIKDRDLILATHGRGFWVIDDLTPLYELKGVDGADDATAQLITPRPTIRYRTNRGFGRESESPYNGYSGGGSTISTYRVVRDEQGNTATKFLDAGKNPPDGVVVYYNLKEKPAEGQEVTLTFLDAAGNEIRGYSSKEPEQKTEVKQDERGGTPSKPPTLPAEAGLNRFVWDMHYPDVTALEGYPQPHGPAHGPLAAPGHYQVRLKLGDVEQTAPFEIQKDPRVSASLEDLEAQFALLSQIASKLGEVNGALTTITRIRKQLDGWEARTKDREGGAKIAEAAKAVRDALEPVEAVLVQPKIKVGEDQLAFPTRLNAKLESLLGSAGAADARPTTQSYALYEELAKEADEQIAALKQVVDTQLTAFNQAVNDAGIPPVEV